MSERGRVLIVDDDDLVRETYDLVLRHHGWSTAVAGAAEEALDLLIGNDGDPSKRFAVLVTDLHMPGGLHGNDLVTVVGRQLPHVGIVVTTGDDVAPGTFGTDVRVLLKPFRMEALVEAADAARHDPSDG